MVEGASPADVPVYPMFSRPEGARMLMDSVLKDRHGKLLRELSCVARENEKTIGFLLSTMLPDGSVLILNIAVAEDRRHGRGRRNAGQAHRRFLFDGAITRYCWP